MNDSITNDTSLSSADISELIHSEYIIYISGLVQCAILSLVVYTTILAIPQEMVYMWLSPKPFSIPSVLYAFTRYGNVLTQAFVLWLYFVPPGRLCNILDYTDGVEVIFNYIGVQGLLIARAYSLCRGNKFVVVVLFLSFLGGLTSFIYGVATGGGCQGFISLTWTMVGNICTVLTDLVVFGVCLWTVWGTWKLKREAGIQSHNDLVSLILKQTMSRFCFVIIFSVALTIIIQLKNTDAINIVGSIQQGDSSHRYKITYYSIPKRGELHTPIYHCGNGRS